jgi:hypothetical protein
MLPFLVGMEGVEPSFTKLRVSAFTVKLHAQNLAGHTRIELVLTP